MNKRLSSFGVFVVVVLSFLLLAVISCGKGKGSTPATSQIQALGSGGDTARVPDEITTEVEAFSPVIIDPGSLAEGGAGASASAVPTPQVADAYKEGEILVGFRAGTSAADAGAAIGGLGAARIKSFPRFNIEHWRIPPGMTVSAAISAISRNPNVEYAEPNYIIYAYAIPDDYYWNLLWGLHNTGQSGGTADADIDAPEAWDTETGSASIIVGMIDSGIDYNHEDLSGNIWTNPGETPNNGIDDDGNGYVDDVHGWDFYNNDNNPMDDNGHGTHTAGTVGAIGNNGTGVAGVTWTVDLMALKFLSGSGSGNTAGAIAAIEYAASFNVRITSNSWGYGGGSNPGLALKNAIANSGALFVAAAGNDGNSQVHYPAGYDLDNIISVAATDRNDGIASFSNYGLSWVDLGAPGVDIASTYPGDGYAWGNGTSMATPHVAGVAALLMAHFTAWDNPQVKTAIMESVDPLSSLSGKTVTGGRLNAAGALGWSPNDPPVADLNASPTNGDAPLTVDFDASGSYDPDGSIVKYEWDWEGDGNYDFDSGTAAIIQHTYNSPGTYDATVKVTGNGGKTDTAFVTISVTGTGGNPGTIAFDGFESRDFSGGTGWNAAWAKSGDASVRSNDSPHSGSYHVRMRRDSGYIERTVDLSASSNVHLKFWAKVRSFEGSDSAGVLVSPDGSNWTTIKRFSSGDSDNQYHGYDIDISGFDMTANFHIAFDANMRSKKDYWYLDDIELTGDSGPVNQSPVANLSANPTNGDAPLTVDFDASGSYDPDGNIAKFEWDWEGDGAFDFDSGTGATVQHIYNSPGAYDATVRVTDDSGKTDTAFVTITVNVPPNDPPVANLSASPTNGDAPLTVDFDASGSYDPDGSIVKYEWDWEGDGNYDFDSGTAAIIQHTYNSPGTYDATVKVTDNGGKTDTAFVTISVTGTGGSPGTIAFDGFESGDFSGGTGWNAAWAKSGDASVRSNDSPHSGSYHVRMRRDSGYIKRSVNLAGATQVHLRLWAKVRSFENSDEAYVLVSPDGTNWTVVKVFTSSESDNQYHYYDIDISGFDMTNGFYIAFDAEMSSKKDYWYLDDIEIFGVK